MVRTRIAPSPTGIPHIGTTRTALFNYLFAKHHNGEFLLRIEDTDRARFVVSAQKAIIEILSWLGLQWDGEVTVQSKRLSLYIEHAEILKKKNLAYEDNGALRFRMPKNGQTSWPDGRKTITFENKTQEDFIIIKSDGFPTYNFANVIDDHAMNITHVIRGEEFISSTPKHIQLYKAFGWKHPIFVHPPVVLGADHQKLSKRHGAKSALEYRDGGYLKEALLNYMALLGWSPGGDREIMSISEMILLFDIKDINVSSPIFDLQKLTWMNQQYIQIKSDKELKVLIKNFYPKAQELAGEILDKLMPLVKTRMATLKDFIELTGYFFAPPEITFRNEKENHAANELYSSFNKINVWDKDAIFAVFKLVMKKYEIRMPVLYYICTGSEKGLPLPESLEILGKKETIDRLGKLI